MITNFLSPNSRVTAIGQLDLNGSAPTFYALPPLTSDFGGINRNYPSVVLQDSEAILAPFTHEEILTVTGTWTEGPILLESVRRSSPPEVTTTDLISLVEAHRPTTGWLPITDGQERGLDERVEELIEQGVVLWRADIPVRTANDMRTVCTYVLAADPERAEQILGPIGGNSLLVRPSAYTKTEIDNVHRALGQATWGFHGVSEGLGPHGDMRITVFVSHLSQELLSWAGTTPAGLLELHSWINGNQPAATDARTRS